ncbi:unnamed protein product [Urochloa humidicola]
MSKILQNTPSSFFSSTLHTLPPVCLGGQPPVDASGVVTARPCRPRVNAQPPTFNPRGDTVLPEPVRRSASPAPAGSTRGMGHRRRIHAGEAELRLQAHRIETGTRVAN